MKHAIFILLLTPCFIFSQHLEKGQQLYDQGKLQEAYAELKVIQLGKTKDSKKEYKSAQKLLNKIDIELKAQVAEQLKHKQDSIFAAVQAREKALSSIQKTKEEFYGCETYRYKPKSLGMKHYLEPNIKVCGDTISAGFIFSNAHSKPLFIDKIAVKLQDETIFYPEITHRDNNYKYSEVGLGHNWTLFVKLTNDQLKAVLNSPIAMFRVIDSGGFTQNYESTSFDSKYKAFNLINTLKLNESFKVILKEINTRKPNALVAN